VRVPPCRAGLRSATELLHTSTDAGAGVLNTEIERLRRNATAAEEQLRRRPGGAATGFAFGG
jgi:hypothetical protein